MALAILLVPPGRADEAPIPLKIRDHRFIPEQLEVASGERHKLLIENEDETAEEFESHTMHREKIVPPKSKIELFIGPLKPGRYEFFGDFHDTTAQGVIIAK
jgi:hypothetical protein